MSYKLTLPIYGVAKPNKSSKNPPINVNWYRNVHYRESNKAKIKFKKMINDQLDQFDIFSTPIRCKYTYYSKGNNGSDVDNFVGIVKKFFQDALVEHGTIHDDNFNYIVGSSEEYGGIDKDNPRVEVEVIEIENT